MARLDFPRFLGSAQERRLVSLIIEPSIWRVRDKRIWDNLIVLVNKLTIRGNFSNCSITLFTGAVGCSFKRL